MTIYQKVAVFIGLVVAPHIPIANGSPYTISDDRVRNLDVTPVLGRGYSIMTNSFQSICMDVPDTTVPSYNYDYTFKSLIGKSNSASNVEKAASGTFSFWWAKGKYNVESNSNSAVQSKSHSIIATMRIERYYSSIREDTASLTDDAAELLNRQDYVGFFRACGPNFVRGIRRAQEVTAMFKFESTDTTKANEYAVTASGSRRRRWWSSDRYSYDYSASSKSKFNDVNSSLEISIIGFGLGLSEEGATDTFVATSLEEFDRVMKFAFKTMTSSESVGVGMVYGIEVAPWVETTQYQIAANLDDQIVVEIPLPRSLIERAFQIADRGNTTGFDNGTNRVDYTCKNPIFSIDKYGYCCEATALFDINTNSYVSDAPESKICKPTRVLDKNNVKANLATNGEFVARLERSVRYKLNQLSTLERCIGSARSFPARFDGHTLKAVDTVNFDSKYDPQFTVKDLKLALDPFNDFALVTHMAKELDEFVDMFYAPCLAALFGMNVPTTPGTDTSFFFAYPWYSHSECLHLSCFGNGMRWDREDGGCVPGLITGSNARAYSSASVESNCKSDPDEGGDAEECKHTTADLSGTFTKMTECWSEALPAGNVDFFMSQYCMPELTGEKGPNIDLVLAGSTGNKCEFRGSGETESRIFFFTHIETDMVFDIVNFGCNDNQKLHAWTLHRGANQQWKYQYESKQITSQHCSNHIVTMKTTDCETDDPIDLVMKTKIGATAAAADPSQQFIFYRDGTVRPVQCPTKALKAEHDGRGAKFVLEFADPDDPLFQFRAEYMDY